GEEEALRLMQQFTEATLLTDDAAARLVARQLGHDVHGTIGILVRAIARRLRSKKQVLNLLRAIPQRSTLFLKKDLLNSITEHLAATVVQKLGVRCLLGCTGESIVGNEREVEQRPALSLWLGRWGQPVRMEPFHLVVEQTPDGYSLMGWPDGLAEADAAEAVV